MEINDRNTRERIILSSLREIMNDNSIEVTDDFFSVGGDSKKAVEFLNVLREQNLNITLRDFFGCRTVQELAKIVSGQKIDYHKTIDRMIDNIRPREKKSVCLPMDEVKVTGKKTYSSIFFTGATGYLGSHIAVQLLESTKSTLFFLVRGKKENICKERVRSVWKEYFQDDIFDIYEKRIRIIPGDVSQKKFGLKATEYNSLAENVDCIIHTAAVVSHVETWEKYEKVNIQGTENILKFSVYIRKKDVNYISTIATEITKKRLKSMEMFTEKCLEEDQSDIWYVQSKIECEKLLENYRKKGCLIKIYRMGFLVQNYHTGRFQINAKENGLFNVLAILNNMKTFPNVRQNIIDLTYVDEAAKAVVELFTLEDNLKIYHIFNPRRISIGYMGEALKKINPEINILELEEYRKFLYENCDKYINQIEKMALILMLDNNIDLNIFGLSCNEKTMKILESQGFSWHDFDEKAANDIYKIIKNEV